jgi:hypothetical protein
VLPGAGRCRDRHSSSNRPERRRSRASPTR